LQLLSTAKVKALTALCRKSKTFLENTIQKFITNKFSVVVKYQGKIQKEENCMSRKFSAIDSLSKTKMKPLLKNMSRSFTLRTKKHQIRLT